MQGNSRLSFILNYSSLTNDLGQRSQRYLLATYKKPYVCLSALFNHAERKADNPISK